MCMPYACELLHEIRRARSYMYKNMKYMDSGLWFIKIKIWCPYVACAVGAPLGQEDRVGSNMRARAR